MLIINSPGTKMLAIGRHVEDGQCQPASRPAQEIAGLCVFCIDKIVKVVCKIKYRNINVQSIASPQFVTCTLLY